MESLLLEKLGDNTINDYGDHQRSWLFATASMDSLGVIYWVDLCVCAYIGKKGEKENGHHTVWQALLGLKKITVVETLSVLKFRPNPTEICKD